MQLFRFKPGDLIVASQINYNFNALRDVLGATSTASELNLPGRMTFGGAHQGSVSALTDKKQSSTRRLHIGWNAEEFVDGDGVGLQRRVQGAQATGSTVVRLSGRGFTVLHTDKTSGNLENQLQSIFALRANKTAYLNPNWSFAITETPSTIADYRLTFKPLTTFHVETRTNTPANFLFRLDCATLENKFKTSHFHGVEMYVLARTTTGNASEVRVYGDGMDPWSGLVVNVPANSTRTERGCVVFKRGTGGNQKLVITSTAALSQVTVRIIGLWK